MMKICSKCKVEKAVTEFHKRSASHDGLNAKCKVCMCAYSRPRSKAYYYENTEKIKLQSRDWHSANPDKVKESQRKWKSANAGKVKEYRAGNHEKIRGYSRKWYELNAESRNQANRTWREANPDLERDRTRAWREANPHIVAALAAKRRAAKLQATPVWVDERYVKLFYEMAMDATASTGIEHQVDHIVPLQSDIVCGLHWEHNLQVLPAVDNIRKGNRHWPDMP